MTALALRPRIAPAALAFQPDLDRLVAEPAPLYLRLWPLIGAALLAAVVLVAATTRIDVVVTATGRLAADAPPVILQPMARAVLRELLVRPGDFVVAGQLVARLDSTMPEADRATLEVERRALSAEAARLQAELSGEALASGDPDLALQAQVQLQRAGLATARRAQLTAARTLIAKALDAEIAAGQGLSDRLAIARQIEAMRAELASRQSGSRLAALEAELARIDAETAQNQHLARVQDLAQRLIEAEAGLTEFAVDQRRQQTEALADLRPRLAQVEEQLTKALRLAALSDLRAPRPGVVLSVAVGGPGSVMAEGAPVVVLIPTDAPLIAEIGIRSSEAGSIAPGDVVELKVDAFPWRRHGMILGRLDDVSPASFTPEGQTAALHSGRITLTGTLTSLPPGTMLLPGMTLTADIKSGTRTVLDYFLEPLMRGLSESLREP